MAIYSKLLEGLNNGDEMFVKVFTVNPKGRVNNRVDLPFASCIPNAFPLEPSAYELIDTYTNATTFVAPEDGYYQIEVHGASGAGGPNGKRGVSGDYIFGAGAGGGGGGGYARSIVKLNKGDTVTITALAVGSTATVYINSSIDIYPNILVSSGSTGKVPDAYTSGGTGGAGGVASGGTEENINGSKGSTGSNKKVTTYSQSKATGGAGGAPGHTDGNKGGTGSQGGYNGSANVLSNNPGSGKAAFVKIYRGNTNVA